MRLALITYLLASLFLASPARALGKRTLPARLDSPYGRQRRNSLPSGGLAAYQVLDMGDLTQLIDDLTACAVNCDPTHYSTLNTDLQTLQSSLSQLSARYQAMQQYLVAQTSALSDFVGHINPNAEALPLDTLSTAVPSPSNSPAPTGDASTTGMAVLLASMHGFISQHLTQTMTQLMTINNIASAVSLYQTEVTSYAQAVQQYGAAALTSSPDLGPLLSALSADEFPDSRSKFFPRGSSSWL